MNEFNPEYLLNNINEAYYNIWDIINLWDKIKATKDFIVYNNLITYNFFQLHNRLKTNIRFINLFCKYNEKDITENVNQIIIELNINFAIILSKMKNKIQKKTILTNEFFADIHNYLIIIIKLNVKIKLEIYI